MDKIDYNNCSDSHHPHYREGGEVPHSVSSRNCFGLAYFTDEETAIRAGEVITKSKATYNGGMFHGMPCGRDKTHDHVTADGTKLFAVTTL